MSVLNCFKRKCYQNRAKIQYAKIAKILIIKI